MPTVLPRCELRLSRHAGTAWTQVMRPWLESGRDRIARRHVVVPTRGQSHALKQRCLAEGVPLLGVEFLTIGLARQKWLALALPDPPAVRDEVLVLGLRALIQERLSALTPDSAAWGFWKSLLSDAGRALEEFKSLLTAGFGPEHFGVPQLRAVFAGLMSWVESLGYSVAPRQNLAAALTAAPPEALRTGAATLIYGFSAENWAEFFDLAAFARRGGDLTVVLPEPELRGARALDEDWIEMWEALLGVEAERLDAPDATSCAGVADLWLGERGAATSSQVLVGRTRADEMVLLVDELAALVASGAGNIAVIFPRADAAHLRLVRLLVARDLPFADLLPTVGPPAVHEQLQRALLAFYARGARLEELLDLWPLLRALNHVRQPLRIIRPLCERVFDELQTHALAAWKARLTELDDPTRGELARIINLLLPAWPEKLTLMDALARFEGVCAHFNLAPPTAWSPLQALAERELRPLPAGIIMEAIESFLPAKSPVADAPGHGGFAPITLTTRRRAAALEWSHVIFAESNAGIWPERVEASCWLPDEQRRALDSAKRFSIGLPADDDRRLLVRQAYGAIARDAREQIIFTAALFEEEEPDLRLAPNAWLERVLLASMPPGSQSGDLERAFSDLARTASPRTDAGAGGVVDDWAAVWRRRQSPVAPFDEYFLSGPPAITRPAHLAARLIERGVADPAVLWFEAVLRLHPVAWRPLERAKERSLGQMVHRMLAHAFSGPPGEGGFRSKPAPAEARGKLDEMLRQVRTRWPDDRYWDSFHAEMAELAGRLLEKVYALETGPYVAVEAALPAGTTIPLESAGRLDVRGRMDLVFLDRPAWEGATVDIVDFKTGTEGALSAARMARGSSLQLGVYLAAAQSLGARSGRVWLLKADGPGAESLEMSELPAALKALRQIGRHLATGRYGALTPDRTEFSRGFDWPLACPPVPHAVLAQKFGLTFELSDNAAVEEDADV